MDEFYTEKGNGVIIKIKAPAVDNKANEELIKFLSKSLKVPKSCVSIDSGNTSKVKIVYIENYTIEQIKSFCDSMSI